MLYLTEIDDISKKLAVDFGGDATVAKMIINKAIDKHKYLNHPRIIRCILYLAKGSFADLEKNVTAAIYDPRDVFMWAEYIDTNEDPKTPKRLRAFNKTFERSEIDISE